MLGHFYWELLFLKFESKKSLFANRHDENGFLFFSKDSLPYCSCTQRQPGSAWPPYLSYPDVMGI